MNEKTLKVFLCNPFLIDLIPKCIFKMLFEHKIQLQKFKKF